MSNDPFGTSSWFLFWRKSKIGRPGRWLVFKRRKQLFVGSISFYLQGSAERFSKETNEVSEVHHQNTAQAMSIMATGATLPPASDVAVFAHETITGMLLLIHYSPLQKNNLSEALRLELFEQTTHSHNRRKRWETAATFKVLRILV